jgi:hypothetical protein
MSKLLLFNVHNTQNSLPSEKLITVNPIIDGINPYAVDLCDPLYGGYQYNILEDSILY